MKVLLLLLTLAASSLALADCPTLTGVYKGAVDSYETTLSLTQTGCEKVELTDNSTQKYSLIADGILRASDDATSDELGNSRCYLRRSYWSDNKLVSESVSQSDSCATPMGDQLIAIEKITMELKGSDLSWNVQMSDAQGEVFYSTSGLFKKVK